MPVTVLDSDLSARRFVILHGWQNHRPTNHWQNWLATELETRKAHVSYPQLPSPDHPLLKDWVIRIEQEIAAYEGLPVTVICHSLSCIAWIHVANHGSRILPVANLIFVAPPSPAFLASEPALAEFQIDRDDHRSVTSSSTNRPRLVCSDDDRFCPERADNVYPGTFDADIVTSAGHLNVEAGYSRWPAMLDWCIDPAKRIRA